MFNGIYRFRFERTCTARDVLDTLHLAILGAECLHGESRVRLEASYCSDAETNTYVIDARTPVGQDIVRLFTGFVSREFGEHAFSIKRLAETAPKPSEAVPA